MTKLITQEGLKKIKDELEERKGPIRRRIAAAIKEAKEQGDLSENAEYTEAKREQGENEMRITQLVSLIKEAEVVDNKKGSGVVQIGSRVKVRFHKREMEFQIVSSNEADPINFKISNESPLGKVFLNKKKGDKVEAKTPQGIVKYEILEVK